MGNQVITKYNLESDEELQSHIDKYFEKIINYTNSNLQDKCIYNEKNCSINDNSSIKSIDIILKKLSNSQKENIITFNDNQLDNKKIIKYYTKKIKLIIKLKHIIYFIINYHFSKLSTISNDNINIIYLNDLTNIYKLLVNEITVSRPGTSKKKIIIKENPITIQDLNKCCIKVNKIMSNLQIH